MRNNKASSLFLQATKHQAICFLCSFCLLMVHLLLCALKPYGWGSFLFYFFKQVWHLWIECYQRKDLIPSQIWTRKLFLMKPKVKSQEISPAWEHISNLALQEHWFQWCHLHPSSFIIWQLWNNYLFFLLHSTHFQPTLCSEVLLLESILDSLGYTHLSIL